MNDGKRPAMGMWSLDKMGRIASAFNSMFNGQNAQQMAFIRQNMKRLRKDFVMDMMLAELEVVVFDLETTGFYANAGDEILSFGAIAVKGEKILEDQCFYMLVNPNRPIPSEIVELTGITDEAAADAPGIMEGLTHFFKFVDKRMLIAHASGHDKQFLNAALWRTSKVHLANRVLDTMMIAKWLDPARTDFSLDSLLSEYKIPIQGRHHALEDSRMTAKLWVAFLKEILRRNIHTLGDLYAYLSRTP